MAIVSLAALNRPCARSRSVGVEQALRRAQRHRSIPLAAQQDHAQSPFAIDLKMGEDIVALHGELDIATVFTLDAAIDRFIDRFKDSGRDLVIDLTDLQFVDSMGLTRFVRLHRQLAEHGARLVLRHARPHVRKVLAITALDQLFGVEE
jgi:anti-sigma B factor antagonist